MEPLSLARVAALVGGRRTGGRAEAEVARVVIDSREVRPGDLFVCLPGPRFDGHEFAAAALRAGAVAVLAERLLPGAGPLILVDDGVEALGRLGHAVRVAARAGRDPLVVAVTGTNGKTGTKDLTAGALSASRRTVASPRSYNNAIGVPLSLLALDGSSEAAVVEVGTNAPGEIGRLAALVEPEVGVITNINRGHLAGLGDLDGVRAEKACLLDELVGRRVSVLNRDDPSFAWLAARAPGEVVTFGLHPEADVRGEDLAPSPRGMTFRLTGGPRVRLAHLGRHAVSNALAALAVARVAGVEREAAAAALERVGSPPGRLQIRELAGVTVLDDSYNANPASLASAVATFRELSPGERRAVVVGDMLELGAAAAELHRLAGAGVAEAEPDLLLAVGAHAGDVLEGARAGGLPPGRGQACADAGEAGCALAAWVRPGDVVLLKGSRRLGLETVLAHLAPSPAAP